MMKKILLRLVFVCGLSVVLVIGYFSFSSSSEKDDNLETVMIGVHHLSSDFLISEFYVNKYGGTGVQRGGGGSGETCCILIPRRWRPGLMVEVRWRVEDWSHAENTEIEAGNYKSIRPIGTYIAQVPVEKYEEANSLYVHFFPNGRVRVFTTHYSVLHPNHPVSYGPKARDTSATAGLPIAEMFTQAEMKYLDHWRNVWK